MKNIWVKYITRRLAVQIAQAWNFGWGEAMKKVYGVSVKDTLIFRDSKKTDYYVDGERFKRYIGGLNNLLKNKKFLRFFHKNARKKLEAILRNITKKLRPDLSKLSNGELLKIYKDDILPNQTQFYIRMWTVFNLGDPLANLVRMELSKLVKDNNKVTEYLLNLSSPLKPNDVLNERTDLLKLAVQKRKLSPELFARKLGAHTKKYQHIPMFDFDHEPYDTSHFIKEIQLIKEPIKELGEIKKLFKQREKDFKKILNLLKADKGLRLLLQFLKENVFLRDYRDMIREKLNLQLRKFYYEIGKRLGLNLSQVAILTNVEIIQCLKKGKKFPSRIIKQREKFYLLIQKGNKVKIYSGKTALFKAKQELKKEKLASTDEIKGIIGSSGKARGKVKIVYTNRDLRKVKNGDILVAPMTRQDFIIAIRKAKALVTDEGSVTAHAAIISRELKIPCLVGTKIATKVLKDGDLVEVDAKAGVVKKIKSLRRPKSAKGGRTMA